MPSTFRMHADVETYNPDGFAPKVGMEIHFDLEIDPGEFMRVSDLVRPTLLDHQTITGYIRSDGRMYDKRPLRAAPHDLDDPGVLGVELLSDDPDLNLESPVTYRVSPLAADGRTPFNPFYITELPTDDTPKHLADFAPGPGHPAVGITKGDKGDKGDPGDDGTNGVDGISITDFRATGNGSYAQAYGLDANSDEVEVGDPVPLTVAWTTVTNWDDPNTVRPDVSQSVIWIGLVAPEFAQHRDVRINCSGVPPTIQTTELNGMNVGAVFSQYLLATGTGPFVWTKLSGTLPPGISPISTEGNLYGLPTTTGTYNFRLEARNPFGAEYHDYTVVVGSAVAPEITTTSLGTLQVGTPFAVPLTVTGSTPITLALKPGDTLPSGFVIDPDPAVGVHGTPAAIGSFNFNVRASNSVGNYDRNFSGTVVGIAPAITTTSLGSLFRNFASTVTQIAATGSSPVTFTKTAGAYPTGVTINSSGAVSGAPSVASESYSFTLQAHNTYGDSTTVTFSGTVAESTPNIVETSFGSMTQGIAFTKTLTLASGGPAITWSHQSGTLPDGVTFDAANHKFSGTPTAGGTSGSVVIRATNGDTQDDQTISWSVAAPNPLFRAVSTPTTSTNTHADNSVAGDTCIVFLCWGSNTSNSMSVSHSTGVTVSQIGSAVFIGNTASTNFYVAAFKYTSTGPGTLTFTPASGTVSRAHVYCATSVGTVSNTLTSASGSLASGTATLALNNVASASNHLVVNCFFSLQQFNSYASYNQTQRSYLSASNNTSLVGESAGAATVSFSVSNTGSASGKWGAMAVDLAA